MKPSTPKKLKVGIFCSCAGCAKNGNAQMIDKVTATQEQLNIANNRRIKENDPYITFEIIS